MRTAFYSYKIQGIYLMGILIKKNEGMGLIKATILWDKLYFMTRTLYHCAMDSYSIVDIGSDPTPFFRLLYALSYLCVIVFYPIQVHENPSTFVTCCHLTLT